MINFSFKWSSPPEYSMEREKPRLAAHASRRNDETAQLVKRISIQPAIGFSSSAFEFVGCSLHHGLRSFIAMDEVLVFFRHERYASKQICNETFNGNVG
jgi:hypothetical protein